MGKIAGEKYEVQFEKCFNAVFESVVK